MLFNLLDGATDGGNATNPAGQYFIWIILAILVIGILVWMVFSGRKGKQSEKEYKEQLDALAPGHKVKTAGGICGIVVEVCDDNTVILETGSEESGKSYVKMDKYSIAVTDAKGPTQIAREEAEAKRKAEKEAKKNGTPLPEESVPAAPAADAEPAPTPASEEASESTPASDGKE